MSDKKIFEFKDTIDKSNNPADIKKVTEEIINYIKETKKVSLNHLTMKFGISFNLCKEILQSLEEQGVISEMDESRNRKVLI